METFKISCFFIYIYKLICQNFNPEILISGQVQDQDQNLYQTFNFGEAWGPRSDLGGRGPSAKDFSSNDVIRYITSIQGNKY